MTGTTISAPQTAVCPCCGFEVQRPDPNVILDALPLGPSERVIARFLAHPRRFGRWVTGSQIIDSLYAGAIVPDRAPDTVKAHVSRIKAKIAPHGLTIERGYRERRMVWIKD